VKGAGSRSGYTRRWGYEGGQMRMHMKMPKRGFSNVRFQKRLESVNLGMIQEHFEDGDEVSYETLFFKRLVRGNGYGVKLLGDGEITKKVVLFVDEISQSAKEKIEKAGIEAKTPAF
jgi:large subunit ribosomal protein L15